MKSVIRFTILLFLFSSVLLSLRSSHVTAAQDQPDSDNDGIPDVQEAQLASLYAPALQFSRGEKFYPVSVEYALLNSILKQKQGDSVTVISNSPTVEMIGGLTDVGSGYFLENTIGGLSQISSDYEAKRSSLGYVVYARVYPDQAGILTNRVVQYWFFYAFNNGPLNDHQGDWEMIQVVLNLSDTPLYAAYSQHISGERTDWQNVEKYATTHPVVYVAEGSHANYFRSVQGRLGFESDIVAVDGVLIQPGQLSVVLLGEEAPTNHATEQRWLTFAGRWGTIGTETDELAGRNGPLGPVYNSDGRKWNTPVVWGLNLFLIDATWFTASLVVANFNLIFLGVVVLLGAWKGISIYRAATKKRLVLSSLLSGRPAIGIGLGLIGIVLTLAGMFAPWFYFSVNIPSGEFATAGTVNIIYLDGVKGLQIGLLDPSEGVVQLGSLGVAFSMIILIGLAFNFLDLVGATSGKTLGRKYITSGVFTLVPVALILVLVVQFSSMVTLFASALTGGVPFEARVIADLIASSPMAGSFTGQIGSYGSASLAWGLGLGSYLLFLAGIVKIVAGVVTRVTSPPAKPEIKP